MPGRKPGSLTVLARRARRFSISPSICAQRHRDVQASLELAQGLQRALHAVSCALNPCYVVPVVRKGGLEPPRAAPPAPKAGASTNSATFACSACTASAACSTSGFSKPAASSAERVSIAQSGAPAVTHAAAARAGAASQSLPFWTEFASIRVSVGHYENFPVASRLVPARCGRRSSRSTASRAPPTTWPTKATRPPPQRLAALDALRRGARRASRAARRPPRAAFPALAAAIREHALPLAAVSRPRLRVPPGRHRRRATRTYADVLDYCRRSANPVGRLLLALYRARDAGQRSRRATPICTGLQLTNFWQDVADRLAQGPRLPAAGGSRPLRRQRARRSREGRADDALARADARSKSRARACAARSRPAADARAAVAPGPRAVGGDQRRPAHPRRASTPSAATCSRAGPCCATRDWCAVAWRALVPAGSAAA